MVEIIKQLALDAVDKGSLCDFCIGTVTSVSPLSICLEQGLEIPEAFLCLTRDVTDYEEYDELRIWRTTEEKEWGDGSWYEYHMKYPRALKAGEQVLLIKASGGQKYVVVDRIRKGGSAQ